MQKRSYERPAFLHALALYCIGIPLSICGLLLDLTANPWLRTAAAGREWTEFILSPHLLAVAYLQHGFLGGIVAGAAITSIALVLWFATSRPT